MFFFPGNCASGIVDSVIKKQHLLSSGTFSPVGSLTINQKLNYSVLTAMMTTESQRRPPVIKHKAKERVGMAVYYFFFFAKLWK